MYQELEQASKDLSIPLYNLRAADIRTQDKIAIAKASVSSYLNKHFKDAAATALGVDIYAFGSIARREISNSSDFDYLIVVNKIDPELKAIRHFRLAAIQAHQAAMLDKPGPSGLFGVVISAPGLVNQIGLNGDTNLSMSRRILILEESLPLNDKDKHGETTRAILNRYLYDYKKEGQEEITDSIVPRFLLNDVVRCWRTIAVDYQAKRWEELDGREEDLAGKKWGLRYIKLRSSRKWTFAGSIVALLMPVIEKKPTTAYYLSQQFELPALARLAQLSKHVRPNGTAAGALRQVLEIADYFVGMFDNEDARIEITGVNDPDSASAPQTFKDARLKTCELQQALEALFYCDEPLPLAGRSLCSLSKQYLAF